jgi:hypothetical protein
MNEHPACEWNIEPIGSDDFPRYVITDGQGQYWNGKHWGPKDKAPIYASFIDAARDYQDLLRREFPTKVPVILTAPLLIELRSGKSIPFEQVQEWLKKAVVVITDLATYGSGPAPETVVLVQVNWDALKSAVPYIRT